MKFLILLIVLSACGTRKVSPHSAPETPKKVLLQQMYDEKLALARASFDQETGWPSRDDCDGTKWAGLAYAAGVKSVRYQLAEHSPGEIHRRPYKSCYPGESATTVSRDMLLGYMFALWAGRDIEASKRLANYGEDRFWKMGSPVDDGRVFLSNGVGVLGRMIKKLGGPDKPYRHLAPAFARVDGDYEKQLLAVHILLNGEIDEGIDRSDVRQVDVSDSQAQLLEWLAENDPKDATFAAAHATYNTGNFEPAIDLLLSDDYLPSYVRGHENYALVYWLFSARLVLIR